jgi:hypothetical protein
MVYLLHTIRYSGHCRSSGAEVFQEQGRPAPEAAGVRLRLYLRRCGHVDSGQSARPWSTIRMFGRGLG